jgi:hypothetical protein
LKVFFTLRGSLNSFFTFSGGKKVSFSKVSAVASQHVERTNKGINIQTLARNSKKKKEFTNNVKPKQFTKPKMDKTTFRGDIFRVF